LKDIDSCGTAFIFTTDIPADKTVQAETVNTDEVDAAKSAINHLLIMLSNNDLSSREIDSKVNQLSANLSVPTLGEVIKYLLNQQRLAHVHPMNSIHRIDITVPDVSDSERFKDALRSGLNFDASMSSFAR
jgi:hypothetical protein